MKSQIPKGLLGISTAPEPFFFKEIPNIQVAAWNFQGTKRIFFRKSQISKGRPFPKGSTLSERVDRTLSERADRPGKGRPFPKWSTLSERVDPS